MSLQVATAKPRLFDAPRWGIIVISWLGFSILMGTQTVVAMRSEGMRHSWPTVFFTTILSWMAWALFTPLIEWMGDRFPLVRWRPISAWAAHIAACLAITVVYSFWTAWLRQMFNPFAPLGGHSSLAQQTKNIGFYEFHLFALLYAGILAVRCYVRAQRGLAMREAEAARLNEALSQAQLEALRRQLEPHFLFNTMNAIAGLVRERRNDDAVTMIAALGDLLRHVLEGTPRQFVSLDEEMRFLRKYLDIQKMRFADSLEISLDVPTGLLATRIPSLILQPMVENAMKHGIDKRRGGGILRIAAAAEGESVTVTIYNNGPNLPAGWENLPAGLGLANVRSRMALLYGGACSLALKNHPQGGVEARLILPAMQQSKI